MTGTRHEPPGDGPPPGIPSSADCDAAITVIGRLRPGSPVRKAAVAVLRGEQASLQPLIAALLAPSAARWREGETAAWALGYAPTDEHERDSAASILMDVLEGARGERLWRRAGRGLARTYGAAFVACFAFAVAVSVERPWMMPWPALFLRALLMLGAALVPVAVPASLLYDRSLTNRVRAAAARSLGRLATPDSVGALATAVFDRSPRVREAATEALHAILPTITDEHYGVLGAQSITSLGRALQHADTQLVFKVLQTLAKVGTSHAIPAVERLAIRGRTVRLRDAAANTLEALRARQGRESQRETLVRAATSPIHSAEALVRPAGGGEEYNTAALLRAATSEEA